MFKIKGTRTLGQFMIASIITILILFSVVVVGTGYYLFTRYYSSEYGESAYKVGLTAKALIKEDHLDRYLENNGEDEEYKLTYERLSILTNNMDVSVIYVVKPDSDYKHYTNVFNVVNKNSGYDPWKIGSRKKTSNKDYENVYKKIMTGKASRATVSRTRDLNGAQPHLTTLIPLKNSKGDVVGILCVQRFMGELRVVRRGYVLGIVLLTILYITMSIVLVKLFIGKEVVQPVMTINNEVKRFANQDVKTIGELNKISIITEIQSLFISIYKIEKDMIKYIDNLTTATKEKERIGTELKLANLIQSNSLPNEFPAFPERDDFDLYALMRPAKEVGGDFYDFFLIDDDHLGIVMADVSGKGVPAALFMMVTKILVNEISHIYESPGEVLTLVNDRICSNNKNNMFITVWLGIVNLKTGEVVAANAGHEDPAIFNGNEFIIDKQKHGIPIGAMDGYKYKDYKFKLKTGNKLFVYTDGVPEAEDDNDKMFGLDNMIKSLNKVKESSCTGILNSMKNDVDKFVNGAVQFDDLTMLCFEYIGKSKIKRKQVFRADVLELDNVLSYVHSVIDKKVKKNQSMKLDVVIEELFVNIAKYAYDDAGDVLIEVLFDKNKLIITFVDEGNPFNPLERDDPDTSLSSDERQIGGLGIYMVKKMMDKVKYEYKDNKNILIIEKKFGGD